MKKNVNIYSNIVKLLAIIIIGLIDTSRSIFPESIKKRRSSKGEI